MQSTTSIFISISLGSALESVAFRYMLEPVEADRVLCRHNSSDEAGELSIRSCSRPGPAYLGCTQVDHRYEFMENQERYTKHGQYTQPSTGDGQPLAQCTGLAADVCAATHPDQHTTTWKFPSRRIVSVCLVS